MRKIIAGILAGMLITVPFGAHAASDRQPPIKPKSSTSSTSTNDSYVGDIVPANSNANTIYRVFFVTESNTGDTYRWFAGPYYKRETADKASQAIRDMKQQGGVPQINDSSVRVVVNTIAS